VDCASPRICIGGLRHLSTPLLNSKFCAQKGAHELGDTRRVLHSGDYNRKMGEASEAMSSCPRIRCGAWVSKTYCQSDTPGMAARKSLSARLGSQGASICFHVSRLSLPRRSVRASLANFILTAVDFDIRAGYTV